MAVIITRAHRQSVWFPIEDGHHHLPYGILANRDYGVPYLLKVGFGGVRRRLLLLFDRCCLVRFPSPTRDYRREPMLIALINWQAL